MVYDAKLEEQLKIQLASIRAEKKKIKEEAKKQDEKLYSTVTETYNGLLKSFDPAQISRIAYNLKKLATEELNKEKGTVKKATKKK